MIDRFARFQNECADVFIETAEHFQPSEEKLVAICSDQFNFIANRSNAIIELLKIDALWDAQILVRPLLESCVKICFLCFQSKADRAVACHEYEEILGIINALKLHDKACKSISGTDTEAHPSLKSLVLSEKQLSELLAKVPKKKLKEVESKWGFTRMMVQLDERFEADFKMAPFTSFAHTYGLSSHLIHADEMGLGAMRARAKLKEPQRSIVEKSHHIALLDAVAGSAMVSAMALSRAAEFNLKKAYVLYEKYRRVHDGSY
ncbi:DUF5677 domain-containing protein [Limnohabitans sp.]|uniref:DUF5677 domain-containing protein n=1 Tax=Limnohabitans sp. TaxID=1907725 RepID=UPI0025C3106F|nr:DUF5677 domain-containing protein [Limnohabitans sp.]